MTNDDADDRYGSVNIDETMCQNVG